MLYAHWTGSSCLAGAGTCPHPSLNAATKVEKSQREQPPPSLVCVCGSAYNLKLVLCGPKL